MMTVKKPRDLILKIVLVHDDDKELSPSIWRTFSVSEHCNLDVFHDKVLLPVMGWERNYHSYAFRATKNKSTWYVQNDCSSSDTMCFGTDYDDPKNPDDYSVKDILEKKGDTAIYIYDLGDAWRHLISVQHTLEGEEATGKVTVLDGAMRCPDEDGGGCKDYQMEVLDLYKKLQLSPRNFKVARELASQCFERVNALNVRECFRPEDFCLQERQLAVQQALRTRNWARNSTKVLGTKQAELPATDVGKIHALPFMKVAELGQIHVSRDYEDDGLSPTVGASLVRGETLNVKPDTKDLTLCCGCGNPLNLKSCSGCQCVWYCSKECQRACWKPDGPLMGHKKDCKLDNVRRIDYEAGKLGKNRFIQGDKLSIKKFDPCKLRFQVGDLVEARVGDDEFAIGRISKCMHVEPGIIAPYQIHIIRGIEGACIPPGVYVFAHFDMDFFVRKWIP